MAISPCFFTRDFWARRSERRTYGSTVSVVCTETLPVVAVITTGIDPETENIGRSNVVLLEPAGTLMLARMRFTRP